MDYSQLLAQVLQHAPYSTWRSVGIGKYRDFSESENPSVQLSSFGLYDYKAGKTIKTLWDIARELQIVGSEKKYHKRSVVLPNPTTSNSGEKQKETQAKIIRKLRNKDSWLAEQWPVIRKYFVEQRAIPEEIVDWKVYYKLGAVLNTYKYQKRNVTEIVIPLLGCDQQLIQTLRIEIDPETGSKISKKSMFPAGNEARAIMLGAVESERVMIVEGLEDGLSIYAALKNGSEERKCLWAICVTCGSGGYGQIGKIIEPYEQRVVVLDNDKDGVGLKASFVLGDKVLRFMPEAVKQDANSVMQSGGAGEVWTWLQKVSSPECCVDWQAEKQKEEEAEEKEHQAAEDDSFEVHREKNPFSEQSTAKYFFKRFGKRIKMTEDGRWWHWTGKQWSTTHSEGIIKSWIASLIVTYSRLAAKYQREGKSEELIAAAYSWAQSLGSSARQAGVMRCLVGMTDILTKVEMFDTRPDILNLENGVLMLESGELEKHSPDFMCSKIANTGWNPKAKCPEFDDFLQDITCHDNDLLGYKLRQLGYMISGYTSEKVLFFHYGSGNNGKSKEVEILQFVLGDYAREVNTELYLETRFTNDALYELAYLPGVRLMTSGETDDRRSWNEAVIKRITGGGDRIVARHIRQAPFSFKPQFKPLIHGNNKPNIKTGDSALWRRLHLVPYLMVLEDKDQDVHLGAKLEAEAEGILRRMVEGYQEWRVKGLCPPQAIIDAVAEYQEEIFDDFQEFIVNECEISPEAEVKASLLYDAYSNFATARHRKVKSQTAFGLFLTKKNFPLKRTKTVRLRVGIKLKDEFADGGSTPDDDDFLM